MSLTIKETEDKLHEQLYNNILLLTYCYSTTKHFDAIFERTMFVKNNKAAFHQIVYYLLKILNPELTKNKISSWPIYEVKQEAQFRKELLTYINELNVEYEDANIPNIMASHLICPGGFKFVRFMLKLSQLVLVEHLKKIESIDLLPPIKPHKNPVVTNIVVNNFKQQMKNNVNKLCQLQDEFNSVCDNVMEEAATIVAEQTEIDAKLSQAVNILKTKEGKFEQKDVALAQMREQYNMLKGKVSQMEKTKQSCEESNESLSYLTSEMSTLVYTNQDNKLDLHELFEKFNNHLQNEKFESPEFDEHKLTEINKTIQEATEKFEQFNKKLNINENILKDSTNILQSGTL